MKLILMIYCLADASFAWLKTLKMLLNHNLLTKQITKPTKLAKYVLKSLDMKYSVLNHEQNYFRSINPALAMKSLAGSNNVMVVVFNENKICIMKTYSGKKHTDRQSISNEI